jgi:hypothetical protein
LVRASLVKVGGSADIYFDGGNNILGQDPHFVDRAEGVYTLKPGSPCIGAGKNGTDLGAFPYGAWTAPAIPEILDGQTCERLVAACSDGPTHATVELTNGKVVTMKNVRLRDHGAPVDSVRLTEGFPMEIVTLTDVSAIARAKDGTAEVILNNGGRKPWNSEGRGVTGTDLESLLPSELTFEQIVRVDFSHDLQNVRNLP